MLPSYPPTSSSSSSSVYPSSTFSSSFFTVQIANLRHQVSVARAREEEMSVDLEEAQDRLARNQDGGQGRSIRDSEDRSEFLKPLRLLTGIMMCL